MTSPFCVPYIANGSGQIVFFLIILIWIIGALLKKASEASKRSFPPGPVKPQHPSEGPTPAARRPTLSDFLKRIQQMAEQGEQPPPPPPPEPEAPMQPPVLRVPSTPSRPPDRRSPVAGPSVLRTPRVKPERRDLRVSPPAQQMEPLQTLKPIGVPLESLPTQELAFSPLLDTQQLDAHGMTKLQQRHISQTLGITLSTDQMKKGIILSEILGPPKAVLRRRHVAAGR